jgi:hypothetical protein
VLGCGWTDGTQSALRFYSFEADGRLRSNRKVMALPPADYISGMELLVHDNTVYACYGQGSFDTVGGGCFALGFPLSELLPVTEKPRLLPADFQVQLYPNPFNGTARLSVDVPASGAMALDIFDLTGRHVSTLASGYRSAGRHELAWNAEGLPSGVYLIRLQSPAGARLQKAFLIR